MSLRVQEERMTNLFKLSMAADKKTVVLEFLPDSGISGSLTLDGDQLIAIIESLGKARAHMAANKPIPPIEGQNIHAVFDTRWYVQPEPVHEASVICFSHPGFGPVGFLVPHEQVREMIRL